MITFSDEKCIEWSGGKSGGYGMISINRKARGVHRVIVEGLLERKLGRTELVCHKCNNKLCFNPMHLYVGDYISNAKDKMLAGMAKNGSHRPEVREKLRNALLGKRHTEERRKNQSIAKKRLYESGYINPTKGRKARPNSGSFGFGRLAPNKGRKRVIDEQGNVKYVSNTIP